jgi:hypothetical protein
MRKLSSLLAVLITIILTFSIVRVGMALEQKDGSPLDKLPAYIWKVNEWGQRADFSHDGNRILFIEKTYGDAFEMDLKTGVTTTATHHYYHGGYTRALYLANGDILLSGTTSFDADNPLINRHDRAELWVLDKSLTKPPVRLNAPCSEGPAVSRRHMRIAWTTKDVQFPDTYKKGEHRVHVGNIIYEKGVAKLVNRKEILNTSTHPFFKKPSSVETQNFIAPDESKITLSLYGYQGGAQTSILDLETGEITKISNIPNHHNEPEGIFPDGKFTLVESSQHFTGERLKNPVQMIDIWKLSLDGKEYWERITHFSDYKGYKSSNPVVSDDGRYIAFQMAKLGDPAGVGRGLFILDLEKRGN